MTRSLPLLLAAALAVGAPLPASAAPASAPLDVAIIWHQHQPLYPKVEYTGVYEQPWVRLHGAKDYYDMAAMVREFPGLHLTINLTPVLLKQIQDYNKGATDRHLQLTEKPAASLTGAEKAEIHRRFFAVSKPMLARYARYGELARKAESAYTTQDWLDLQVLFNLAWTDAMFLQSGQLAKLAAKGRHFTEADKRELLKAHRRILAGIIPLHRKLQDQGRIEVTTTPFYHPILPLIDDTRAAKEAMPQAPMPEGRLNRPDDARFHVREAVRYYHDLFGRNPRGMWPGEGSVAQAVAPLFKEAGIRWIATDEEVLARSLNVKLRDGETLVRPDVLYRPYAVKAGPAILFRDRKLSDDIGFRYGKMPGKAAAEDLLGQLRAIAKAPHDGPRLVSIILDGENAWENYPDDGKAFLRTLYRGLTTDKLLNTVTPSEYLAAHTPRKLDRLWAGSWIAGSFSTWIGEPEENAAWDMLIDAREAVEAYGKRKGRKSPGYKLALEQIHAAEGSDWFWWYGQDQDSGHDEDFDAAYRRLIAGVYRAIGQKAPAAVDVPIVQKGAEPTKKPKGYLTPTIDGELARLEWADAGAVFARGGAMNLGDRKLAALFYGWDKRNLYLAVQFNGDARPFKLHLGLPERPGGVEKPQAGMTTDFEAAVTPRKDQATLVVAGKLPPVKGGITARGGKGICELAVPWSALGVHTGDPVLVALEAPGEVFPQPPLRLEAPMLPLSSVVSLQDAADPGIGPGRYTLPTGDDYTRARVDLKGLSVADAGANWAFTWKLGDVANPWASPVGLSLVTLDLYMALAEEAGELTPLLPERQALATRPWAYALSIEGWQHALYGPDGARIADVPVAVDDTTGEVRAFVPKQLLPGSPRDWRFLAVLAAQDGFAPGRVRRVLPTADADHFGGRPDATWPQILDVLLPESLPQEQALTPTYGRVVLPYVTPGGKVEGTE